MDGYYAVGSLGPSTPFATLHKALKPIWFD